MENGFKITGIDFSGEALKRSSMFVKRRNYVINTIQMDLSKQDLFNNIGMFDNIIINHYRLSKDSFIDIKNHISYDNPNWATPKIVDKPYHVMGRDIGHPLITDDRICNNIEIDARTKALLITDSNMSGKSIYLRTIGINMVLAYAGAPVCAKEFYCNIFSIYTCMRVSDNLEKNSSSFYAELLRIKKIVDVSKNDKVFFLLDEVFKGTNSQDRHEGAKILVNKLVDNKAI